MFLNNIFQLLEETKNQGAFDNIGSYGSILSIVIPGLFGIILAILKIYQKKAKPGSTASECIKAALEGTAKIEDKLIDLMKAKNNPTKEKSSKEHKKKKS